MSGELRVAILGAGGVGGYYGGALARAGHPVALLARGAHLEAIRARGLEVRTPEGRFTVAVEASDDVTALGPADLAIVAVKTYSLGEILPAARLLAKTGAVVLPLLNGVEAADRLVAGGVPKGSVLGGLTQVSVARVAPGVDREEESRSRTSRWGSSAAGRPRARSGSHRRSGMRGPRPACRRTSLPISGGSSPSSPRWRLLAGWRGHRSAPCATRRTGICSSPALVREVLAVARARRVALGEDEETKILAFVDGLGAAMKPSFLLDLEAGGPNELDDLSGAVSRLGREAGVETPVHDTAVAALAAARPRP